MGISTELLWGEATQAAESTSVHGDSWVGHATPALQPPNSFAVEMWVTHILAQPPFLDCCTSLMGLKWTTRPAASLICHWSTCPTVWFNLVSLAGQSYHHCFYTPKRGPDHAAAAPGETTATGGEQR